MKNKRYTGREINVRKIASALFIIAGLLVVFGGVGSLEHDYISLKSGIITMFSGCVSLLVGLSLGRLI